MRNQVKPVKGQSAYPEPNPIELPKLRQALKGERRPIGSLIARIREQTSTNNWKCARKQQCEMHIAIAYLVLGDHDKAIETLEAASEMEGPLFLNRELNHCFIFDWLREIRG